MVNIPSEGSKGRDRSPYRSGSDTEDHSEEQKEEQKDDGTFPLVVASLNSAHRNHICIVRRR